MEIVMVLNNVCLGGFWLVTFISVTLNTRWVVMVMVTISFWYFWLWRCKERMRVWMQVDDNRVRDQIGDDFWVRWLAVDE